MDPPPAPTAALTVALVTDIHFGPDTLFQGKLRKLCRLAPALLRDVVAALDADARPDLLVNLGDDIEDQSHAQDAALYSRCQDVLRGSRAELLNLAGNHDTVHLAPADLARAWGRPGPLYRSLDRGGFHLVALHTTERKDVDVALDEAQLAWLADDLRATALPTLVFMHHSASEQDTDDSRWFRGAAHLALLRNRAAVRAVLEASGRVRAVFNGHLHRNHVDVIRGIPYVTVQSLIENLDDDAPGRPAGAYALVRATAARVVVRVLGADPARYQFEA